MLTFDTRVFASLLKHLEWNSLANSHKTQFHQSLNCFKKNLEFIKFGLFVGGFMLHDLKRLSRSPGGGLIQ